MCEPWLSVITRRNCIRLLDDFGDGSFQNLHAVDMSMALSAVVFTLKTEKIDHYSIC
jgi:hypothetical protein